MNLTKVVLSSRDLQDDEQAYRLFWTGCRWYYNQTLVQNKEWEVSAVLKSVWLIQHFVSKDS